MSRCAFCVLSGTVLLILAAARPAPGQQPGTGTEPAPAARTDRPIQPFRRRPNRRGESSSRARRRVREARRGRTTRRAQDASAAPRRNAALAPGARQPGTALRPAAEHPRPLARGNHRVLKPLGTAGILLGAGRAGRSTPSARSAGIIRAAAIACSEPMGAASSLGSATATSGGPAKSWPCWPATGCRRPTRSELASGRPPLPI